MTSFSQHTAQHTIFIGTLKYVAFVSYLLFFLSNFFLSLAILCTPLLKTEKLYPTIAFFPTLLSLSLAVSLSLLQFNSIAIFNSRVFVHVYTIGRRWKCYRISSRFETCLHLFFICNLFLLFSCCTYWILNIERKRKLRDQLQLFFALCNSVSFRSVFMNQYGNERRRRKIDIFIDSSDRCEEW